MKTILRIASIIMLLVGICFIHDVMSASFLYPEAPLKFTKGAVMKYKENNKVNEEDYKNIERCLDSAIASHIALCGQYGAIKIYGALCLFLSSLLMYIASRKYNNGIQPNTAPPVG